MPTKPKKNGRQNYDWVKIKHDYVTDPQMSLRKIAAKYGISYKTVALKSKADNWFASRKEHQSRMESKLISETEDLRAKAIMMESDYLRMLTEHLGEILRDKEQFHRHLNTNLVTGEMTEGIYGKADTKALKDSFQMLQMADDLFMAINSLERIENIKKHELDAERLALEREKFEWEKRKTEMLKPAAGHVIKIEGFEEGWSK